MIPYHYLSKVYSRSVLRDFARFGRSDYFDAILEESDLVRKASDYRSLSEVYEFLYGIFADEYRFEYFYKNELIIKILLGKYSLNTAGALTEFRVNNAKVDLVILNGTTIAYEIKTELDNLNRLDRQLTAYAQIFEYVNVVLHESMLEKEEDINFPGVGVIAYTAHGTFREVKEAVSNGHAINSDALMFSLRKPEYCELFLSFFDHLPKVPNTRLFEEVQRRLRTVSAADLQKRMVDVLTKRSNQNIDIPWIKALPNSLKCIGLNANFYESERRALMQVLQHPYKPRYRK